MRSTIRPELQRAAEAALQEGLAQYEQGAGRVEFRTPEGNLADAMRSAWSAGLACSTNVMLAHAPGKGQGEAVNLEFEQAARVRDQLALLREQVLGGAGHDNVVVLSGKG